MKKFLNNMLSLNPMRIKYSLIKLLFMVLILTCSCSSVNVQKQTNIEQKQLFDDDWKFHLGDTTSASLKDFNDTNWAKLDLPHDWSIEEGIDQKDPSGSAGGYFRTGIGWYRKTFNIPDDWKDKKTSIYFEGVYMNSEVFINGTSLGVYPYGYSAFSYDLTPFLDFDNENVIAVRVDNSQQINSRWYTGSGIYRHVWIMVNNPIHVAQWGTAVSSSEVSKERATIDVKTMVKNETELPQDLIVKVNILDNLSKIVGTTKTSIAIPLKSEKEVLHSINVDEPQLWDLESPNLYQANIQVIKDDEIINETNVNFGIRSIEFSVENGFQLNGKTVKINGGCLHHDNGILGSAAYDRAEERKVEILKAAGFNAVRTAHNPPSEAFLDACDRLGLLVMDEAS